eukprot:CAMPEP_0178937040 /NCGR_PEP_ID=MMETSP0786-20121207/25525_1 /TAXON_ID=186022 /ORGANISM="Thalassionema frauenfeldii, Strain CCMP 1798" /LENGTH=60 /DNA_ID=CAMNT_0020615545 /DNA_START=395 /DNA_END=577 /DNA_ORIENTATION=+
MEITNTLGPVTKHYKPPTIEDAPGYYEGYEEDHPMGLGDIETWMGRLFKLVTPKLQVSKY